MAKLNHGLNHNNRYTRVQILEEELNQTILSDWEKLTEIIPEGLVLVSFLFLSIVYLKL